MVCGYCRPVIWTLSIKLINEKFGYQQVIIYLGGIILSSLVSYICLRQIKAIDNDTKLANYHGYTYERPKTGLIFLITCLDLIGLPLTPTSIGIGLIFSHIKTGEIVHILFTSLKFLFVELAIFKIYVRIFMGQHKKNDHPVAFKYS